VSTTRRYRVRHETVYSYGGEVAHSHQLLHLEPRVAPNQTTHRHSLELLPSPSSRRDDVDAFGNPVTRLEYDRPHDRLEVLARVDVEVRAPPPMASDAALTWEQVRQALEYPANQASAEVLEASRFRMESGHVRIKHGFTDYGADCFEPGRPILSAALALMHKMNRDFTYAPGTTDTQTSVLDAFAARRGVCQDFAHIMLACLRSRGLAARYVSGYLRTVPLPKADAADAIVAAGSLDAGPVEADLVGADASHAWVSVFCPPFGWVDLDPTNDCAVSTDHITVAWGRDFGDVSPLRGVIRGGGRHRLSVRVSVQPE
jgi:transglutaminase-like putative cysteine protease